MYLIRSFGNAAIAFFLISIPGYFHAQTVKESIPKVNIVSEANQDVRPELIKPIAVGAGYTILGLFTYRYLDTRIKNVVQHNQNRIATGFFNTIGYAGLGKSNLVAGVALGVSAFAAKDDLLKKATINFIGAHLLNDLITNQLKITFQRHRPNTGDLYNTFDWRGGAKKNKSFVSAHTSNIFTTATVLAMSFHDEKWIPVTVYSLATLVGLSRIYQNAHWTSDVIGGAAVGYLSARLMDKLYSTLGRKFSFIPFGGGQCGILLSYVF